MYCKAYLFLKTFKLAKSYSMVKNVKYVTYVM